MLKPKVLLPDAARVIEGLRDTGYQFSTAVADVVDNSIAAEADKIDIFLKQDFRGRITLRIYDDGLGMSEMELENAMTYGSKARKSKASLGKFGLGLKTASTAFCQKLTVVTRDKSSGPLHEAVWDLEHVRQTDKWEALKGEAEESERKAFDEILKGQRGTLVMWDDVDRLMKTYKDPAGAAARNAFDKIVENLRAHLAMVYQRFLDPGDKRARTVWMNLNGSPVKAWDPFMRGISREEGDESIDVDLPDGKKASFTIRAFILPRKEEMDEETWRRAKLKGEMQGIYVYRENRLIHGPDWLNLFTIEPHYTLIRVEFSFDHRLDEAFQIDIKKSQILLDEGIASFVEEFLTPRRRAGAEHYRRGTRENIARRTREAHDVSNRTISAKEDSVAKPNVKSTDSAKGTAVLVNRLGEVRLKLRISKAQKKDEMHVQAVDSIDDGLLWEPTLIDGHVAVRINRGHPYYAKVYVPNLKNGVTIQGMDSLLWALSVAELNAVSESTLDTFVDLRYDVSKTLKKLVEDLPEPDLDKE
jgi:hypothetical protein